jgi:putative nucleotidyltransferase with HDIG domain
MRLKERDFPGAEEPITTALIDALIEELERLPAQPSIAMRVVWIADDPGSSAKDLAAVIAADPSLTARVLKLANSAYYGLSGRVANVGFAVTVIGFPTVRAMAAATASGLFDDGDRVAPEGFWDHAVSVATACSMLAGRVGVRPADAFSLGLLHDLGSALLFRSDPERFDRIVERSKADRRPLSILEKETFGIAHDEAAARVFAAWRFPEDFVVAVGEHHDDLGPSANPFARLLCTSEAVAARLSGSPWWELTRHRDEGLSAMRLSVLEATQLAKAVKDESAQLMNAFS